MESERQQNDSLADSYLRLGVSVLIDYHSAASPASFYYVFQCGWRGGVSRITELSPIARLDAELLDALKAVGGGGCANVVVVVVVVVVTRAAPRVRIRRCYAAMTRLIRIYITAAFFCSLRSGTAGGEDEVAKMKQRSKLKRRMKAARKEVDSKPSH